MQDSGQKDRSQDLDLKRPDEERASREAPPAEDLPRESQPYLQYDHFLRVIRR